VIKKNWEAK